LGSASSASKRSPLFPTMVPEDQVAEEEDAYNFSIINRKIEIMHCYFY
jgi:hypothetical protein